jgi:hypothetical protein
MSDISSDLAVIANKDNVLVRLEKLEREFAAYQNTYSKENISDEQMSNRSSFGDGEVVIDDNGIAIKAPTEQNDVNSYKFVNADNEVISYWDIYKTHYLNTIYSNIVLHGDSDNNYSFLEIKAIDSAEDNYARVILYTKNGMYTDSAAIIGIKEGTVINYLGIGTAGVDCTNGLYPKQAFLTGNSFQWFSASDVQYAPTTNVLNSTNQYAGCYALNSAAEAENGGYVIANVPLDVGTYTINFVYLKLDSAGKFDLYVDGTHYGATLDCYASSASYNNQADYTSIVISYKGVHTIKFLANGKNASSSEYRLGLSLVNIVRTGD